MTIDEPRTDLAGPPLRRRGWPSFLLLPLLFFLLGIIAAGWLLSNWDQAARFVGIVPEPVPALPAPQPQLLVPTPDGEGSTPQEVTLDPQVIQRLAALEQRIAEIGVQSREAVGNADRAEGLLVAFAARRALDRGVPLGFLEALLRQRFGDTQPQAVGTIIAAAREPVTLQELQDGLQEVSPQLVGPAPDQGWWDALKVELSNLITVRREGSPSTEPAERLRRATRRLEAGQVDVALAEVLRLPGHAKAARWVSGARRYVAARRALDTIETAALLEPRMRNAIPIPASALPPAPPAPETTATPAAPPAG